VTDAGNVDLDDDDDNKTIENKMAGYTLVCFLSLTVCEVIPQHRVFLANLMVTELV
jgi:hypothetical protein